MIIDYKNENEFALSNGVKPENNIGETWFEGEDVCKGITFKNFFHLCVEHTVFEDCVFDTITALNDQGYIIYSVYGKKRKLKIFFNSI